MNMVPSRHWRPLLLCSYILFLCRSSSSCFSHGWLLLLHFIVFSRLKSRVPFHISPTSLVSCNVNDYTTITKRELQSGAFCLSAFLRMLLLLICLPTARQRNGSTTSVEIVVAVGNMSCWGFNSFKIILMRTKMSVRTRVVEDKRCKVDAGQTDKPWAKKSLQTDTSGGWFADYVTRFAVYRESFTRIWRVVVAKLQDPSISRHAGQSASNNCLALNEDDTCGKLYNFTPGLAAANEVVLETSVNALSSRLSGSVKLRVWSSYDAGRFFATTMPATWKNAWVWIASHQVNYSALIVRRCDVTKTQLLEWVDWALGDKRTAHTTCTPRCCLLVQRKTFKGKA